MGGSSALEQLELGSNTLWGVKEGRTAIRDKPVRDGYIGLIFQAGALEHAASRPVGAQCLRKNAFRAGAKASNGVSCTAGCSSRHMRVALGTSERNRSRLGHVANDAEHHADS